MAKKNSTNYPIGYGKPPTATQFKKGQSGNPNGRPIGAKNIGKQLDELLQSKVTVRDGDGTRQMVGMDAMLHTLMVNAIKGDIRSIREVTRLVHQYQAQQGAANTQHPPEVPATRGGVLVVPHILGREDWEIIHGTGPVDREELRAALRRMYKKGQVLVMGGVPPGFDDPD